MTNSRPQVSNSARPNAPVTYSQVPSAQTHGQCVANRRDGDFAGASKTDKLHAGIVLTVLPNNLQAVTRLSLK
jgi:hypothetical protein